MISLRLRARPLDGGTRVAEGVSEREVFRAERSGRPVVVVGGTGTAVAAEATAVAGSACEVAAGPLCVLVPGSISADASVGDETLLSLAKGRDVADGGACETSWSAPSEDWAPSVAISEEGDSSASEVAGVVLALGARFLAFSCIAKHRNRCCSGSSMTGGGRAEAAGLLEATRVTGLDERTTPCSGLRPIALVGPPRADPFDAMLTEGLAGEDRAARVTEGVGSSEAFTRVLASLGASKSLAGPAFNALEVRAAGSSSTTVADLAMDLSASAPAVAAAVAAFAVGAPELTRLSPDWDGASLAIAMGTGRDVGRTGPADWLEEAGRGRRVPGPPDGRELIPAVAGLGRGNPLTDRAGLSGDDNLCPNIADAEFCPREALDATDGPCEDDTPLEAGCAAAAAAAGAEASRCCMAFAAPDRADGGRLVP